MTDGPFEPHEDPDAAPPGRIGVRFELTVEPHAWAAVRLALDAMCRVTGRPPDAVLVGLIRSALDRPRDYERFAVAAGNGDLTVPEVRRRLAHVVSAAAGVPVPKPDPRPARAAPGRPADPRPALFDDGDGDDGDGDGDDGDGDDGDGDGDDGDGDGDDGDGDGDGPGTAAGPDVALVEDLLRERAGYEGKAHYVARLVRGRVDLLDVTSRRLQDVLLRHEGTRVLTRTERRRAINGEASRASAGSHGRR